MVMSPKTEIAREKYRLHKVSQTSSVKDFCARNGITFVRGTIFYELVKPELVQGTKKIVVLDVNNDRLYTGRWAREVLGLPTYDKDVTIRPRPVSGCRVFIQSTSVNRKLVAGQSLLVEDRLCAGKRTDWTPPEQESILTVWDRLMDDEKEPLRHAG
jgi:hypothetical protein